MVWSLTTCDKLKYPITNTDTFIELNSVSGSAELCALLGSPATKHVVLEIYSASSAEQVIAYACEAGKVKITRANSGTTAKAWPFSACLRTLQIIDAPLCGEVQTAEPDCGCVSSPWEGFTVCDSFTLSMANPSAPVMCLKPTGVVAGTYCGLKVNEFGQVTFIPSNFPMSCLPIFDPCGDCGDSGGGGHGGATAASGVSYSPQAGASVVIAHTVQLAIEQLEDYIQANVGGSVGVTSVSGTAPINVTGSASTRTVEHATSPLSAGTYGGFTVDAWGHITGYSAVSSSITINPGAGINASSISPGVWDISSLYATSVTQGTVKFVPGGDIGGGVPVPTTCAVSYGNLTEWWSTKTNAVCSQPTSGTLSFADKISICQSGTSVLTSIGAVSAFIGAPHARMCLDGTNFIYRDNINSAAPIPSGHSIAMVSQTASGDFQVIATRQDGDSSVAKITLTSPTSFTVVWHYPWTGVLAAVPSKMYVTVIGG